LESKKHGKEKLHALVKKCMCSKNVLHVNHFRHSQKRHGHTSVNITLLSATRSTTTKSTSNENVVLSLPQIQFLMKEFKTHRSALDIEEVCECGSA